MLLYYVKDLQVSVYRLLRIFRYNRMSIYTDGDSQNGDDCTKILRLSLHDILTVTNRLVMYGLWISFYYHS